MNLRIKSEIKKAIRGAVKGKGGVSKEEKLGSYFSVVKRKRKKSKKLDTRTFRSKRESKSVKQTVYSSPRVSGYSSFDRKKKKSVLWSSKSNKCKGSFSGKMSSKKSSKLGQRYNPFTANKAAKILFSEERDKFISPRFGMSSKMRSYVSGGSRKKDRPSGGGSMQKNRNRFFVNAAAKTNTKSSSPKSVKRHFQKSYQNIGYGKKSSNANTPKSKLMSFFKHPIFKTQDAKRSSVSRSRSKKGRRKKKFESQFCVEHPLERAKYYVDKENSVVKTAKSGKKFYDKFCSKCAVKLAMDGYLVKEVQDDGEVVRKTRISDFLVKVKNMRLDNKCKMRDTGNIDGGLKRFFETQNENLKKFFIKAKIELESKYEKFNSLLHKINHKVFSDFENYRKSIMEKDANLANIIKDIEKNMEEIIKNIDMDPFNKIIANYKKKISTLNKKIKLSSQLNFLNLNFNTKHLPKFFDNLLEVEETHQNFQKLDLKTIIEKSKIEGSEVLAKAYMKMSQQSTHQRNLSHIESHSNDISKSSHNCVSRITHANNHETSLNEFNFQFYKNSRAEFEAANSSGNKTLSFHISQKSSIPRYRTEENLIKSTRKGKAESDKNLFDSFLKKMPQNDDLSENNQSYTTLKKEILGSSLLETNNAHLSMKIDKGQKKNISLNQNLNVTSSIFKRKSYSFENSEYDNAGNTSLFNTTPSKSETENSTTQFLNILDKINEGNKFTENKINKNINKKSKPHLIHTPETAKDVTSIPVVRQNNGVENILEMHQPSHNDIIFECSKEWTIVQTPELGQKKNHKMVRSRYEGSEILESWGFGPGTFVDSENKKMKFRIVPVSEAKPAEQGSPGAMMKCQKKLFIEAAESGEG